MVDDLNNLRRHSTPVRFVVTAAGWVLLLCAALVGGWIATEGDLIKFGWGGPSERDVINAAREFVEAVDHSRIARPGRWQTKWESVITTPPPSDPSYHVGEPRHGRWEVQGVGNVHDSLGERRLRWNVILSREGGDWFCEHAEIGADDESADE